MSPTMIACRLSDCQLWCHRPCCVRQSTLILVIGRWLAAAELNVMGFLQSHREPGDYSSSFLNLCSSFCTAAGKQVELTDVRSKAVSFPGLGRHPCPARLQKAQRLQQVLQRMQVLVVCKEAVAPLLHAATPLCGQVVLPHPCIVTGRVYLHCPILLCKVELRRRLGFCVVAACSLKQEM